MEEMVLSTEDTHKRMGRFTVCVHACACACAEILKPGTERLEAVKCEDQSSLINLYLQAAEPRGQSG